MELVPGDPILGLTEAYNADSRPTKVNLGVGIYYDESGRIPLLRAVKQIEQQLAAEANRAATCRSMACRRTRRRRVSWCSARIRRCWPLAA